MGYEIEILGSQFVVDYSTLITSRPQPATGPTWDCGGEPAEAGEFEVEIESIRYAEAVGNRVNKALELPLWLNCLIARHIEGDASVYREVFDGRNDGPDPDYAYDAMRDERDFGQGSPSRDIDF